MSKFVFPERTYDVMDSDTKSALEIINMIRKVKGWAEIPDLPMGSRNSCWSCPIYFALTENGEAEKGAGNFMRLDAGLDLVLGGREPDKYCPMYAVVSEWVRSFDDGMYREYDRDWEPSDEEIYRNNPHVHADAEHPLNPVNPNRQDWH